MFVDIFFRRRPYAFEKSVFSESARQPFLTVFRTKEEYSTKFENTTKYKRESRTIFSHDVSDGTLQFDNITSDAYQTTPLTEPI
jgi:hypothetical protein